MSGTRSLTIGMHGAGKCVGAGDVHRARAAHALAAGPAEGEGGIDGVLDPDQRVKHHRAAFVHVDPVGVDARVLASLWVEAVDAVFAPASLFGAGRWRVPRFALFDL